MTNKPRFVVLKSFVSLEDQQELCREAVDCHSRYRKPEEFDINATNVPESEGSVKLDLGIGCGGSLSTNLPLATKIVHKAFAMAREEYEEDSKFREATETLRTLQRDETPLSGLSLLYGPHAFMTSHYDSPTQPGQRQEWLTCISLGASVVFRCNKELLTVQSGDVLVMDSMAVLHGVEQVVTESADQFPLSGIIPSSTRLGIIMWQGKPQQADTLQTTAELDGIDNLFETDSDA